VTIGTYGTYEVVAYMVVLGFNLDENVVYLENYGTSCFGISSRLGRDVSKDI
jgi:hypothetical protein